MGSKSLEDALKAIENVKDILISGTAFIIQPIKDTRIDLGIGLTT